MTDEEMTSEEAIKEAKRQVERQLQVRPETARILLLHIDNLEAKVKRMALWGEQEDVIGTDVPAEKMRKYRAENPNIPRNRGIA